MRGWRSSLRGNMYVISTCACGMLFSGAFGSGSFDGLNEPTIARRKRISADL